MSVLNTTNMVANTVSNKNYEYERYISEHTKNVWKAFRKICAICKDESFIKEGNLFNELYGNCLSHDSSKYSKEEFDAYRAYFYPVSDEEKNRPETKENFDRAWKHHYTVNPHHWEHWLEDGTDPEDDANYKEIPIVYIVEMVADWMAMGIKFNNTASEYYTNNRNKIHLHPNTRHILEYLLEKVDN